MLEFDCDFRYPSGFDLRFAFTAGKEVTALVGPSGSGKTTVLQLIAGLLTPTRGRIVFGDHIYLDIAQRIDSPPEARSVGLVFQDYQLFPHMTVRENLLYGYRRSPNPHWDFAHLADVLELQSLLQRYPLTLSGGQRQRVAIGRAILRGPELLLLDEPLSALDRAIKANVTEFLRRTLSEFRIPTLLVSHDTESVASLATTIVSLG